jgi:N-acetylglucosaminyl-diphospho-decaprenol L-rhamnosyltransferase
MTADLNQIDLNQVSVVTVLYNSAHCLPALAASLSAMPHVVLVDNASSDGSAEQAAQLLPQARVIRNENNLGFGAANNRALAQVKTPFALLLNPDCEIQSADIEQLLAIAAQHPQAAVIAPQLTDSQDRPTVNYRWPASLWASQGAAADALCCVGFVCGAVMLLRCEHFADLGYFDEHFFLYYEDDDLCLRLFQARKALLLAPQVRVRHRSRGSVKGSWRAMLRSEYLRGFHHAQSKIKFLAKHGCTGQAAAKQRQVLALAVLGFPLRLLLPVPRHVARWWGRMVGLSRLQL